MIIAGILIVGAVIGTFVFVKNNPNKTKKIDAAVRDAAQKASDAAKAEYEKLRKK